MVLVVLLIGLLLGSLLSKDWVVTQLWTGAILKVRSGMYSNRDYSSLGCAEDCIFSDLQTGGAVYISFSLISLILMLTWLTHLVYSTRGVEVLCTWRRDLVLGSMVVCQWIGIITWGAVTGLGFEGSEQRSSTGPALAVSVAVINPLVVLLYSFIFKFRETIEVPNMDSVRVERRHKWSDVKNPDEMENRN